jgi:hypothetical protein
MLFDYAYATGGQTVLIHGAAHSIDRMPGRASFPEAATLSPIPIKVSHARNPPIDIPIAPTEQSGGA